MTASQLPLPLAPDYARAKRADFLAWTRSRLGAGWTFPRAARLEAAWYVEALERRPDLFDPTYGHPFTAAWEGYFASGSNHADEAAGLARAGWHVGVAVQEIDRAGLLWTALLALAGTRTRVFCDSGAYSEAHVPADGPPSWPRPIAHAEWLRRLGVYRELAALLRSQFWCVAPDRVADQIVTLDRQARYRRQLRDLAALGAHVIVPIQNGPVPLAVAWTAAQVLLGPGTWIAGLPMQKDAISDAELAAFLATARPAAVHLLGLGPTRPRYADVLRIIHSTLPHAEVTCDSVFFRRLIGRTNGPSGGPRPYTVAQDLARAVGASVKGLAVELVTGEVDRLRAGRAIAGGWRDPELVDGSGAGEALSARAAS